MSRLRGKVALITGAARGQGRSHAVRLAEEGADIIAVDLCRDIDTVPYPGATEDDLAETVAQVEALDRRVVARQADVRDLSALTRAVGEGAEALGGVDIVCANAGIASFGSTIELDETVWQDMLDINVTGVWKTVKAAVPRMIEQGRGGSVILTSSVAGLTAFSQLAHYSAAKHGVVGLMRVLAGELAPHRIRVNSVHPGNTHTPMIDNDAARTLFLGDPRIEGREDEVRRNFMAMNALPVPWVDPLDISNAVLHLASDEARYVTGTTAVVDAGLLLPFKVPHS